MKRVYLTATTLKKNFGKACFVSLLTIASFTRVHAQTVADTTASASVSYQGYINDQYAFLMKYNNETGEKFTVHISDSEGHTLYREIFSDKNFSKVFKTHLETGSLTFIISNPKKKEEKRFKVNAERHLAEEFSVTKGR